MAVAFVLSDDGYLVNLDHVERLVPVSGQEQWQLVNPSGFVLGLICGTCNHVHAKVNLASARVSPLGE